MMNAVKKCLVWDLDNTLWGGVCLEGKVRVKKQVLRTLKELDRRGILHSIASRGDEDCALKALEENKVDKFFLVPQINWLPKSQNILKISKELRLSLDSIAFIDDDRFELEQVAYMLPDVLTIESEKAKELPGLSFFSPQEITAEARQRRGSYQAELHRKKSELGFKTREDFLLSCGMELKVRRIKEKDIPRVLELMTRTHQLNTTGLMLDHDELIELIHKKSGKSLIMVAELRDRFGRYGIIGTALIETAPIWKLKYLALSCRVMGRGIERAFLASVVRGALQQGTNSVAAEFRDTGRNRMMRALYQMMGFQLDENSRHSHTVIFRAKLEDVPEMPRWVKVA
jgi:FkbH-like protein